eukprot:6209903-Pleurochrysis_carterae.AAC.4
MHSFALEVWHNTERTAVNKEIYALENDEAYAAAVKAQLDGSRQQASQAEAEAHARKLKEEEEAREAQREAMEKAREARMAAAALEPVRRARLRRGMLQIHIDVRQLDPAAKILDRLDSLRIRITFRARAVISHLCRKFSFANKEDAQRPPIYCAQHLPPAAFRCFTVDSRLRTLASSNTRVQLLGACHPCFHLGASLALTRRAYTRSHARAYARTHAQETDGECHMSVNVLKKGDGETVPKKGEQAQDVEPDSVEAAHPST